MFNVKRYNNPTVKIDDVVSGLDPTRHIIFQARRLRLIVLQHRARRVMVVAHRKARNRVKAPAGIPFHAIVNDPALAPIGVIGDGGMAFFQNARVATRVMRGGDHGVGAFDIGLHAVNTARKLACRNEAHEKQGKLCHFHHHL